MENIAFENEIIVVDENWIPQNKINWESCSEVVIENIKKRVPHIISSWWITKELDASQIEMKNIWPKRTLEEAQEELLYLFWLVRDTITQEYWLFISQSVVPNQDFTPEVSTWIERYKQIHEILLKVWLDYRRATNIAWMHINVDTDLEGYFRLNSLVYDLLVSRDFETLWISIERLKAYMKAIDWINLWLWAKLNAMWRKFKTLDEMKAEILDENWEPKFDYWFTRLKKSWIQYIWELRSVDWCLNEEDLLKKTSLAYLLVKESRKKFNWIILWETQVT